MLGDVGGAIAAAVAPPRLQLANRLEAFKPIVESVQPWLELLPRLAAQHIVADGGVEVAHDQQQHLKQKSKLGRGVREGLRMRVWARVRVTDHHREGVDPASLTAIMQKANEPNPDGATKEGEG
jgi:hypothetical protein